MKKPLTVAHDLPQHASFSLIACRTPITQLSTPIEQHQSHGFPSGRLKETWLRKHKLSHLHTLLATVLMNPGLSSSGQRIRFTACQQICLGISINVRTQTPQSQKSSMKEELCKITSSKLKEEFLIVSVRIIIQIS